MSYKQMPRLGSAIATTILSVFSGVLLVGVDQAQAAVLTYKFAAERGSPSGFFKVDNSSVTGIEVETIAVSQGRLYTAFNLADYKKQPKEYYDLAGAIAYFYQGNFRGLYASGGDYITPEDNIIEYEGVIYYRGISGSASWSMDLKRFSGYQEVIVGCCIARVVDYGSPVSYTLVKTETVPEPLTAGGTALALAGLSWLKHKKKMAA
jgi:hypothetical protein